MADLPVFTDQTRIHLRPPRMICWKAYAEAYGKAQRMLFAATQSGIDTVDLKREYLLRFGITARQFNSIRMEQEGKGRSIAELRPQQIAAAEVRIRKAEKRGAHKMAPPPLPPPNPAGCTTGSPRRDSVASIALLTVR